MPSSTHAGVVAAVIAVLAGCASPPPRGIETPPVAAPAPVAEVTPTPTAEVTPGPAPDAARPAAVAEVTVLPAREDDLWMRIRSGFQLADLNSPLVKQNEKWYSSQPDYVQRMTERSQLYLFHIVEEVERRRLPSEIALLPMIESAFNPKAYSRSHASGIWQFIPSTGKHFGLDQNWWYDGRRNVLAATNAALDYLERLHAKFGSWELALAAYNAGEGTVSRAIAANQARGLPADYGSLGLPVETRNYVPKLLAIKNIIGDPEAYGLKLNDVPNKPFFTAVQVKKHIDVALAARFADMTVEEFVALNPAYTKPVITHNDNERLLLPTTKVETFNANMRRFGDGQLHTWQAYHGGKGERVDKIAAKFGMTPAQLRSLNALQERRGKLKTAQLLLVPLHPAKPLPTAAQIAANKPKPEAVGPPVPQAYQVQKGDTLYALARRFGTTVDALAAHNKLEDGIVKVGDDIEVPTVNDKLPHSEVATVAEEGDAADMKAIPALAEVSAQPVAVRPVTKTAHPTPVARPSFYKVRRGDTLYGIAQKFQVAVADLMRWNNLRSASKLVPGVRVKVFSVVR